MRYVIYGPGAIGGTLAGRLAQHGHDVALVARGRHLEALRDGGLTLQTPDGSTNFDLPVVGAPSELRLDSANDTMVLAMKTQDTADALEALAASAPPDLPVVCAQNGVENERLALRRFARVYAMCVMLPATYLEPGVVRAHSAPATGILDLGRYPSGTDETADAIATDLDGSTFSSVARPDVMRFKWAKLLLNLGNALEAACGAHDERSLDLYARARDEGRAVLEAAGIEVASDDEDRRRRGDLLGLRPVEGQRREGGSSWQSLARGVGSIETDYLNGEVVLLGRLHGVATPVNALLQEVADELARKRMPPGSVGVEELERRLAEG